jgi:DNA polymerase
MPDGPARNDQLLRMVVHELESLYRSGVDQLRSGSWSAEAPAVDAVRAAGQTPAAEDVATGGSGAVSRARSTARPDRSREAHQQDSAMPRQPRRNPAQRQAALAELARDVGGCTDCPELVRCRTQTVFGVGNPQARLCFFGEAPGADEDRLGEPFVGRAGQLLTKIIEACTLRREDVYILNVLKCRPPGNRNPTSEEAANCRRFFERQLEIIQPEFICCLGSIAATTLLETNTPIGRLRGRLHEWRGIRVLVTYHPAYLLRNPAAKRMVWDDMKMLMREMGIRLPR